jgi:hypothetical protein
MRSPQYIRQKYVISEFRGSLVCGKDFLSFQSKDLHKDVALMLGTEHMTESSHQLVVLVKAAEQA